LRSGTPIEGRSAAAFAQPKQALDRLSPQYRLAGQKTGCENYRYQSDLFPASWFRLAYDAPAVQDAANGYEMRGTNTLRAKIR